MENTKAAFVFELPPIVELKPVGNIGRIEMIRILGEKSENQQFSSKVQQRPLKNSVDLTYPNVSAYESLTSIKEGSVEKRFEKLTMGNVPGANFRPIRSTTEIPIESIHDERAYAFMRWDEESIKNYAELQAASRKLFSRPKK